MTISQQLCVRFSLPCRTGLALNQLEAGRCTHLQSHCQHCCHHSTAHADRHHAHPCDCQAAGLRVEQQGMRHQTAYKTLSFLQPPCPAGMARERHHPFEWSLLMRAFASWKVCKAYWRPRTRAYAKSNEMQVSKAYNTSSQRDIDQSTRSSSGCLICYLAAMHTCRCSACMVNSAAHKQPVMILLTICVIACS